MKFELSGALFLGFTSASCGKAPGIYCYDIAKHTRRTCTQHKARRTLLLSSSE